MFGIAHGLVHLHANNIIHGDLKPVGPLLENRHSYLILFQSNILIYIDVYHRVTPQIADFGRAKILDVSGYTGSLHFTNKCVI
jgi:serine/threonine protein kinase